MLVNLDLLKMVSEEKKDTFISTGLSSMDDIEKAVKILEKIIAFELMHCVSTYPMKSSDANLKTIITQKKNLNVKLDIVVMKQD